MKLALFGLLCLPAALAVTPSGANLEDCNFTVGANMTALTSYKFTERGDTPVNILGLGDCELTAVAVGGGGSGYIGGGGSGYIVSSTITFPASELVVRVGGPGELSSLETSEGQTIITAQPGGNGSASITLKLRISLIYIVCTPISKSIYFLKQNYLLQDAPSRLASTLP